MPYMATIGVVLGLIFAILIIWSLQSLKWPTPKSLSQKAASTRESPVSAEESKSATDNSPATGTPVDSQTQATQPTPQPTPEPNQEPPGAPSEESRELDALADKSADSPGEKERVIELEKGQLVLDIGSDTEDGVDGTAVEIFSKRGTEFFGIKTSGDRFAYVIDSSSSMAAYRENTIALELVKKEVMSSIKRLTKEQKITVVFYDDVEIRNPDFEEAPVTQEIKKTLPEWFETIYPMGGTDPTAALTRVLEGNYHVVFLLSDGEFSPTVVRWVAEKNKKRIVIHCVSLERDSYTLREIAKQSGGQFILVK
jgi:hypothetical protein